MVEPKSRSYLIRGGRLYGPEDRGEKDVLIGGNEILRVKDRISPPEELEVEVIDASGKIVIPGLVDLHVHITGGGGESGPRSRVPEIPLSEIVEAGVTTVAGVLGTDNVSRSPEDLLMKVKALNERITALGYTGSYHLPSSTITDSVKTDVSLIEEFIGVKCAISDHRSSQPTTRELARLASRARVGGMLGNVPGLVHLHAGDGASGLGPIFEVLEETEIPPTQFLPTHVGRNQDLLNQGIELVRRGGFIDLTCPGDPRNETQALVSLVETLLESGIPLSHVTLSSDSNGSLPEFDEDGNLVEMSRAKIGSILQTFSELVRKELLPLPEALSLVTKNPARRLGVFPRKGSIAEGRDADLVVLGEKLEPEVAIVGGDLLLKEKETLVEGPYE